MKTRLRVYFAARCFRQNLLIPEMPKSEQNSSLSPRGAAGIDMVCARTLRVDLGESILASRS